MRWLLVVGMLLGVPGCVSVRYQHPGAALEPREGETLVFGRVRFFHDGREFFPWEPNVAPPALGVNPERHLWLLRLGRHAVSAELHPDPDGTLAIWLADGDYALVGSVEIPESGTPPYEVVGLLRVPAKARSLYAGDLKLATKTWEGWHASRGELGEGSVTVLPIDIARKVMEERLGAAAPQLAASPWCAGAGLPEFDDARLGARAKDLLDHGCGKGD